MSRPTGSYGDFSISKRDAGNEVGTMRGSAQIITAANRDDQDDLFDAFTAAVDALTLGNTEKTEYFKTFEGATVTPTNGATRELKLLVMYQCTATGKRYTMTVPTLNPALPVYVQNVSVKDAIRTDTPAQITGFITAFLVLGLLLFFRQMFRRLSAAWGGGGVE